MRMVAEQRGARTWSRRRFATLALAGCLGACGAVKSQIRNDLADPQWASDLYQMACLQTLPWNAEDAVSRVVSRTVSSGTSESTVMVWAHEVDSEGRIVATSWLALSGDRSYLGADITESTWQFEWVDDNLLRAVTPRAPARELLFRTEGRCTLTSVGSEVRP